MYNLLRDPDHDINELQRVISLGGNVDNYKRGLRCYLRNNVIIEYVLPSLTTLESWLIQL